jgi:TATA-box binding protein (TBP) (component of TFIID and TFIIIB)
MVETRGKSLKDIDQAIRQKSSSFTFGTLRRRNAGAIALENVVASDSIHRPT